MTIIEIVNSISPFIKRATSRISKVDLTTKFEFIIVVHANCPIMDDLFAMGRFISFLELIKDKYNLKLSIDFNKLSEIRKRKLRSMGFINYCIDRKINLLKVEQISFSGIKAKTDILSSRKIYSECIHPIKLREITPTNDEGSAHIQTNVILKEIFLTIRQNSENYKNICSISLEMNRIIYGILNELIINSITHSDSKHILVAILISREQLTSTRPHRPGKTFESGIDKFDVLAMDFGSGIVSTVSKELIEKDSRKNSDYFKCLPWNNELILLKNLEEATLCSCYYGNLMIRKGRKSQGLQELAKNVSLFDGILNLYSGRTELQVVRNPTGGLLSRTRKFTKWNNYLPGVITSIVLPSEKLGNETRSQLLLKTTTTDQERISRQSEIHIISKIPKKIFSTISEIEIIRSSELYAREFMEFYNANNNLSKNRVHDAYFHGIDLKNSVNINVDFLDSLIQDISKLDAINFDLLRRIFFMNVPIKTIRQLRDRNCNSFLMIKKSYCLLIDSENQPHFLGIPRTTHNIFDVEDFFKTLFTVGSISESKLRKIWHFKEMQIDYLQELIGKDYKDLIYYTTKKGETTYHSYNILDDLIRQYIKQIKNLEDCVMNPELGCFIILANNTTVNKIVDFKKYWSTTQHLVLASKLISEKLTKLNYTVSSFITFNHNGDTLAGMVRALTAIEKLVIVDPESPKTWSRTQINGDCFILLDSIYPGDESGRIPEFISYLCDNSKNECNILFILAFCDFRTDRSLIRVNCGSHEIDIEVISIINKESQYFQYTKSCFPEVPLLNVNHRVMKVINGKLEYTSNPIRRNNESDKLDNRLNQSRIFHKYSDIELSAEFWHNVSTLELISPSIIGRESRDILFYENNERILENHRTRRFLESYLKDFVRNNLNFKVEVILHPHHSVGSYLAQLIAQQLPKPVTIIPLRQREYGGEIEISKADFSGIKKLLSKSNNQTPRVLIVDDSILSGKTVFTMIGISNILDLKVAGIFVLLNRLTPEVSASIDSLNLEFSYLYRLHMPILPERQCADIEIRRWAEVLEEEYKSFFIQRFSSYVKNGTETSYFVRGRENIEKEFLKKGGGFLKPDIELEKNLSKNDQILFSKKHFVSNRDMYSKTYFDTHKIKQIIEGLILHDNPTILDFYTRLAIAYNFNQVLVEEKSFKILMDYFLEFGIQDGYENSEITFLRKLVYIVAFSKHIQQKGINRSFVTFIEDCILKVVKGGFTQLVKFPTLIGDMLISLSAISDYTLFTLGDKIIPDLISPILDQKQNYSNQNRENARHILSAYSWSLGVLIRIKNLSVQQVHIDIITKHFDSVSNDGDSLIFLLDIFEPFVNEFTSLQDSLLIHREKDKEELIDSLKSNDYSNPLFEYLTNAPGYYFTLKLILYLCNAETVVLYTKSKNDDHYFIRDYLNRSDKKSKRQVGRNSFSNKALSDLVKNRMDEKIFFFTEDLQDLDEINRFARGSNHKWMFGSSVRSAYESEDYFIVLGFSRFVLNEHDADYYDKSSIVTAYFYWMQYEKILRVILPKIHEKYFVSSTSWNVMVQSSKTLHTGDSPDLEIKEVLKLAVARLELGELDLSGITMSQPMTFENVYNELDEQIIRLEESYEYLCNNKLDLSSIKIKKDLKITLSPPLEPKCHFKRIIYNNSVMKSVLYELLINSISYRKSGETILELIFEIESSIDYTGIGIKLKCSNKYDGRDYKIGYGINRIIAVMEAISGRYLSNLTDNRFNTELIFPAFIVPIQFEDV